MNMPKRYNFNIEHRWDAKNNYRIVKKINNSPKTVRVKMGTRRVGPNRYKRLLIGQRITMGVKSLLCVGAGNITSAIEHSQDDPIFRTFMSRNLCRAVYPGAAQQEVGYKITKNAINKFKIYGAEYEKDALRQIVKKLESCATTFKKEGDFCEYLKSIGITTIKHQQVIMFNSKPRRDLKQISLSKDDVRAVAAIVQLGVSEIVQGGNCNEHADTAMGLVFKNLDEIEEELGVQYVGRGGLIGVDHEFLLLAPKELGSYTQKTNIFKQKGSTMPNGTICIDTWPTLGQALMWEDSAWGKKRDATVNLRWSMSTTKLKELKHSFKRNPGKYGVDPNWENLIKNKTTLTAAVRNANTSMKDQLKSDKILLKELNESCPHKKVNGMLKCKRIRFECKRAGECKRKYFDTLYHFWDNHATSAMAYYTGNVFTAKSYWKKEWEAINEVMEKIVPLVIT